MSGLSLVRPATEHMVAAADFVAEFPEKHINGSYGIKRTEHYAERLDVINRPRRYYDVLPEGFVPATTFFGLRKSDGLIVGILDVRHELTEGLLKNGGNIGYSVRPTERKKGYATMMLAAALEFCRELGLQRALVSCDRDNPASARVIVKNGGLLENEVPEDDGNILQRYWIEL